MGIPGLNFSAPSVSGYTGGSANVGSQNTGSQFSFGSATWPFGDNGSPFGSLNATASNPWKYAAIGLVVVGVLLATHRLNLRGK